MHPDCPRFDDCNASMCPMMPVEYLKKLRGFYVDEDEICTRREKATTDLVQGQRRLQKTDATGVFTYRMIMSMKTIRSGLQGLPLGVYSGDRLHREAQQWISRRKDRHRSTAA